jgi:Putative peptidoglycan binding domain
VTIAMPDSILTVNLPGGYPAYLGYTDGFWPTVTELEKLFPHARLVSLTVRGGKAMGCDVESGDLTPAGGVQWADDAIRAGQFRPVIYASASTMVTGIVPGLEKLKVPLASVRLISAHYGAGEHVCGPSTCKYEQGGQVIPSMDGTQWTDTFAGVNGAAIDMSSLSDNFFCGPPPASVSWEDELMATISTVQQGSSGQAVRNWQGLLSAHGYSLAPDGIDGSFGAVTDAQTRSFQAASKLAQDGVVGPDTWTAALA